MVKWIGVSLWRVFSAFNMFNQFALPVQFQLNRYRLLLLPNKYSSIATMSVQIYYHYVFSRNATFVSAFRCQLIRNRHLNDVVTASASSSASAITETTTLGAGSGKLTMERRKVERCNHLNSSKYFF